MTECRSRQRAYSSVLRDEQQELTRGRIMKAVADLIREGRIHSFTVGEVARGAAVSYASVYRHFPTRERLLEEVYEWLQLRHDAPLLPDSLEAIPTWVDTLVAYFEANADIAYAGAMALTALGLTPKVQRERDEFTQRLVAKAASGLDPQQVRVRAAVVRYLVSALAWATLRQRFGLDSREVSSALRWALETLVRELRRYEAPQNEGHQNTRRGGVT